MDPTLQKVPQQLRANLQEVDNYLESSTDAAAAVEPDKVGAVVAYGGYAGSATCDGDEKTESVSLLKLNQQF